jgi:hypothetical protein
MGYAIDCDLRPKSANSPCQNTCDCNHCSKIFSLLSTVLYAKRSETYPSFLYKHSKFFPTHATRIISIALPLNQRVASLWFGNCSS